MHNQTDQDRISLPTPPVCEEAREEAVFQALAAFEARKTTGEQKLARAAGASWRGFLMRRDFQFVTAAVLMALLVAPMGFWKNVPDIQSPAPQQQQAAIQIPETKPAIRPEPSAPPMVVSEAVPQDFSKKDESIANAMPPTAKEKLLAQGGETQKQVEVPSAPLAEDAYALGGRAVRQEFEAPGKPSVLSPSHDRFANAESNGFRNVMQDALSTFSMNVDTASYAMMRKALQHNRLPDPKSVRTEEFINYFNYGYAVPKSAKEPFATEISIMPHPWAGDRKLLRIGIQGYQLQDAERPAANLVFLIDTSGSMDQPDRLPLLRQSFTMLVQNLRPEDRVAIVAYAGSAGVVLNPTKARESGKILAALNRLSAGGSTAGGAGLRLAYELAQQNFDPKAVNRVMLATDGDFNVGISSREDLKRFIEQKRKTGIYFSVLGFGMGNLRDDLMQTLAQNGNGVAAYIDTLAEARKVLVEEATSALFPIASDAKIQVEFNPDLVSEYRLVGYETRALKREDFNNDKVDAGEVGAGANVTAIYEIVPKGAKPGVDASRYQPQDGAKPATGQKGDEYGFLKIRYKLPGEATSQLMTRPITRADEVETFEKAPQSARFAVAVAGFGELLRGNGQMGDVTYDSIIALANKARGEDPNGYRAEFVNLVRLAKSVSELEGRE